MPLWRTGRLQCRRMGTLQRGKCTAEVREQTVFLCSADLGAAMGLRGALRPVLWRKWTRVQEPCEGLRPFRSPRLC